MFGVLVMVLLAVFNYTSGSAARVYDLDKQLSVDHLRIDTLETANKDLKLERAANKKAYDDKLDRMQGQINALNALAGLDPVTFKKLAERAQAANQP